MDPNDDEALEFLFETLGEETTMDGIDEEGSVKDFFLEQRKDILVEGDHLFFLYQLEDYIIDKIKTVPPISNIAVRNEEFIEKFCDSGMDLGSYVFIVPITRPDGSSFELMVCVSEDENGEVTFDPHVKSYPSITYEKILFQYMFPDGQVQTDLLLDHFLDSFKLYQITSRDNFRPLIEVPGAIFGDTPENIVWCYSEEYFD
jgi:hypothetical protein